MITSKSNEQVKFLASLKNKKYREKYSMYTIEGIKLIGEMIDSERAWRPSEFIVYSTEIVSKLNNGKSLIEKLEKTTIKCVAVSSEVYSHITDTETPQGVMAVLTIPTFDDETKMKQLVEQVNTNKQFLVLDKISDAGNMGTIIRTAVTFGIDTIICINGTVDIYNPKVVRSTMGAIQKLNIYYVSDKMYTSLVKFLINNNYSVIATDLKAKNYLHEFTKKKNRVFVMGNEANGISENIKKLCTDYIKIPIGPNQESLNVAVATGICLYDSYIKSNKIYIDILNYKG